MKLYASWSPNPQKVLFALKELGECPEIVGIDLFKGEQATPSFAALNPMQKVPVAEDNGFVLWESNAILAWLGERHQKLWPQDALGRASALRWMFFEARHVAEAIGNLWFYESVAPIIGLPVDKEATERGHADIQKPLRVLDQHFSQALWMHDDEFTLIDCCIGTDLAALAVSKFDWKEYPLSRAYADRIRERKAWRSTREPDEFWEPALHRFRVVVETGRDNAVNNDAKRNRS